MATIEQIDAAIAKKQKLQAIDEAIARKQSMQLGTPEERMSLTKPIDMNQRYAADIHQQGVDMAAGVAEPAAAMASGMVAAPVAQIGGGIQQVLNPQNPVAGFQARDRIQDFFTYKPRTQAGQEAMLSPESAPARAIQAADEFVHRGEEVYDATGNETLARIVEALPSWGAAALASLGLRQPSAKPAVDKAGNLVSDMSKDAKIAMDIRNTPQKTTTAKYKLSDGKVIKDPAGKAALSQNWTPETVAGVKGANAATKGKVREIVNIARNRLTGGAEAKMRTRPSDVAGESLMSRYQFVKGANKSSGQLLNKIAKDLGGKGVKVDISEPLQWLKSRLNENGIQIIDGKIDFSNSSLAKSDYGLIRENLTQLDRITKGPMTFDKAHQLKQIMRRTGLSYKQTIAKTGASPETQSMFKGFSGKIDEILDGQSKAYDAQNVKFADTRGVMDSIEKIAKDNLFTESADTQLGVLTRRMMGNPVSRGSIIDMADNIDDIAKKYGGKFDDDLYLQSWVAHDMDDVIEVAAKTSIKGEAVGPQVVGAMERSSVGHVAQALDTAGKFIGRTSEVKALDTLQALTR